MDLTQILKDCPKGTKLYSPIFGEVEFEKIIDEPLFPVKVNIPDSGWMRFTKEGKYGNHKGGECMLFPSKDNRDWSTFKLGKQQHNFEPFEHVLVWDQIDGCWVNDFYAYFDTNRGLHQCVMHSARECLPFAGNEALLGTNDEPKNGGIKGDFGTNGGEVVLQYNELQNKMKEE